jgi:hypothetical protein
MLWMAPPTGTVSAFSPCHPGLIEQHDGVGVPRAARREAIEEYAHGVGIDLGEDEREGIVSGRPPGGLEVGGNEALVR